MGSGFTFSGLKPELKKSVTVELGRARQHHLDRGAGFLAQGPLKFDRRAGPAPDDQCDQSGSGGTVFNIAS